MATEGIFGGSPAGYGGWGGTLMQQDWMQEGARMQQESLAAERRERALRGFDVLVEGGDLSLRPNARELAVREFGEEFVRDWEGSDESVREMLAGMRFNEAVMRRRGEDEIDALMRYRDATGDRSLMDDAAMWRHYSQARKAEMEKMKAERSEEFAQMVSRVVRSSEPMTEEERVAIVKGGVSLEDVAAAKSAFREYAANPKVSRARAIYHAVEGRDVARGLLVAAVADQERDFVGEAPGATGFAEGLYAMMPDVDDLAPRGEVNEVADYGGGRVERFDVPGNLVGDFMRDEARKAGADIRRGTAAEVQEIQEREARRERDAEAFFGELQEAAKAGREKALDASGLGTLARSAVGEFLGMALAFSSGPGSAAAAAGIWQDVHAGLTHRGAGHTEPMDDETYGELVRTLGREKADQMRADWQREASRAAVDWTSTAYAAAEYAAMRIGLGAARRLGGRLLPRQTGRLVSGLAPLNSRLWGAALTGAAGATFDLGVAMPLSRGAMKWAYDQLPWSDPKLAEGAEELAGAWDEMQKWRYWFKTGVMAMTGGAMHMLGARKRAQKILGERKGALVAGLTGEQFDSTLFLPEGERVGRLSALYRENMEKEPEEAIKRGIAAGKADTDHQKAAQMRQDRAIEGAMRMRGYSIEPGENGKGRLYYGGSVNEKGEYSRGEKFLELDERELDTFVEQVLGDSIRDLGAVLREEVGKKRLVDVFKARLRGEVSVEWMRAETYGQIKRAGERAKERMEQRVAEELEKNPEADEAEVRRAVQGEVAEDIGKRPLGELAKRADEAKQRAAIYEAKTGKPLPENAPFTMAAVKTLEGPRKRRVLRIANEATVEHMAEEFGEQLMVDWMEQEGMDFVTAFLMLDALRQNMLKSGDARMRELAGRFLTLEGRLPEVYRRVRETGGTDSVAELAEVRRDVIEALSTLMLNDFRTMARKGGVELPGWARPLFDVMERDSLEFHQEMALGTALAKAREEGWMPEAVEKMLGMSEGEIKEALAEEPGVDEYVSAFREAQRREAEFDSHYGRMHSMEESERLYQAAAAGQAEVDAAREEEERAERERSDEQIQEMEAEPENAGKSHEEVVKERAERYGDAKQEEIEDNPAAESDAAFCGGKCLAVEDETGLVCRGGLVELGRLTILPNFKEGAHNETGVVVPLTGDYRPDHDPIRVWERGDGSLVVISGRHRLDAARRAGATRIMAYVYREDARHDELWAKRFDIESNIRDNQATALEVALYVRGEYTDGRALTDEEVARAGIDRGGKLGAVGYAIGREAVEEVIQAFKRGELDEREAFAIAHGCPGDEKVQRAGLKMARSGGGKLMIQERMVAERSKQEMQASLGLGGKDLFGESLDDDEFMDFVTKYVVRRRNELAKDIQYIRINAGKRNSQKMADKYGVDVKDPDGIKKKMAELEALRDRWMHPYTDGELMDEVRAAWRAEHPDGKASASEMVFKTFSENAAALAHMQMVHDEPYNEHIDFSVAGAKAAGIEDARKRGMTYVDPADGKEKFVIPLRGKDGKPLARLNTNFTRGQLMGVPVGGHKTVTMGALMSYPELYRNYPDLEKMKVRLYNPLPGDTHGELGYSRPALMGEAQFIALNVGAIRAVSGGDKAREERYVLDALLHEGQHAIQHYEGFAGGASSAMDKAACLRYIEQAESDLKTRGVNDDWSRDNLKYLQNLRRMIAQSAEETEEFEALRAYLYSYSHGELEARWTGEGNGEEGGSPWLGWEQGTRTWQTVSVISHEMPDMLGGGVYRGLGRFGRLLEDRLGTAGDFEFDRRIMQMLENIQRRMRELKLQQGKEADGLKLAAEGSALMDSLALLLPDTYRFALEPYKVYFASYAKLRDTGDTYGAGKAVPMRGWDDRMAGAYERILREVLRNVARKGEAEFWTDALVEFPDLVRSLGDMQQVYAREWKAAEQRHPRPEHESRSARRARLGEMDRETMTAMEQQYPELMKDLRKAIGGMRADRMMGKFLERVRLQLDAFRKDRTLGRIRRAVDQLTPKGSRDGKPVKGHIGAEAYRRVLDYVRLMELTQGQDELFMEKYAPEDSETVDEAYQGKRKWSEVAPEELVEVRTYDADGKEYTISCTKQEYEVYSCFDTMSSAQAEAAGRALGEYIATGRQAWENAEDAARQRIAARCTPLLEGFSETENERRGRRKAEERAVLSPVKKVLNLFNPTMNDAQFFDALSGVKEIEPWAREFTERIAAAHVYMEGKEKERHGFLMHALMQASGESDRRRVRAWFDGVNESRDTGVRLVPGEPDFLGRETDALRLQFLGLLRRKTHMKNFRPNTFAEALRFLSAEARADVPEQIIREAVEKYGSIGNAADSRLKKEEALASVLTAEEYQKYRKMVDSVKGRAEAARKKWQEENKARLADRPGDGGEPLELTRLEAAYRVLMCQQEDYRDMLALQGYDAVTVARLEKYAGEDVMKLAYALREKLGERTEEIRELYERVYGMPFPAVENYFRAYFDVNQAERRETTLDGQGTGKAAGGGRVRILYTRRHHNQKLDPTMDVLTAFNAAMREQDVLIGYGDLPSDITRLVNYRTEEGVRMVDALRATIGVDATDTMMLHANNMKQLTGGVEEVGRTFLRLLRRVSSPSAVMILNFRVASLVKQYTALLNTVAGSDLVGLRDWSKSAGRVGCGLGKISLAEMARRPELSTRFKGWWTGAEKDMMFGYGDNVSAGQATEGAWRAGMSLMEWVDVRQNVKSACILYDAVYRKLQKQERGASHEELDMLAMNEVRRALALKSQPQDFRQRALLGAKAGVFKVGNMFLGGESWNLLGNCARLLARRKPGDLKRLAEVWLSHGAALSVLTMAYNMVTDDEEQWKKRNLLANFLWGTLMGPVNGIPFLAQLGGGVVNAAGMFLPKGWRGWVQTSSIVPMGDLNRVMSDFKKAWGKHGTWQDKSIAVNNALRFLLTLSAAAFSNPTTKTGAAIKGASYAAGAVGNVVDFLLRVERAAEERL